MAWDTEREDLAKAILEASAVGVRNFGATAVRLAELVVGPQTFTVPTVHLNGTSKQALVDQYQDSAVALAEAIRVISTNGPNGRDYYLQGPDAIKRADQEHEARLRRLREVLADLERMVETIDAIQDRNRS